MNGLSTCRGLVFARLPSSLIDHTQISHQVHNITPIDQSHILHKYTHSSFREIKNLFECDFNKTLVHKRKHVYGPLLSLKKTYL